MPPDLDLETAPGREGLPSLPILSSELLEEEDFEEEEPFDERRSILITGASGDIGRKLRAAWVDTHELILLDRDPGGDPEVVAADLSNPDEGWIEYFQGVDTVVHLEASQDESATWEELEGPNLDVLFHVGHAAAMAGVERFVFAGSVHAIGGYRDLEISPITVELPPKPDGPFGASKLVGERLGKSLAQMFDITFVGLRLGVVQRGENRPETLSDDWARSLWLSNGDLVHLFTRAVEAELDPGDFIVVIGLSNNRGTRWRLTEAAKWLGYVPDDDAWR